MDDVQTLGKLEAIMLRDLAWALSNATGVLPDQVRRHHGFLDLYSLLPTFSSRMYQRSRGYRHGVMRQLAADPAYWAWLRALSRVVGRYTVLLEPQQQHQQQHEGKAGSGAEGRAGSGAEGKAGSGPRIVCTDRRIAGLISPRVRPALDVNCANETAVLEAVGLFPAGALPISAIVRGVLRKTGWCSVHPGYQPYAKWLIKEQLLHRPRPRGKGALPVNTTTTAAAAPPSASPSASSVASLSAPSRALANPHQQRLAALFHMLYQSQPVYRRHRWLGAAVQQNPFDMYAIMDIIHTLAPDLIVETGTANGGSALMWASMLELTRPGSGARVITIDVNEPTTDSWAGKSAKDPTRNPLWAKYVTFIKGSPLDAAVVGRVRQAASQVATTGGPAATLVLIGRCSYPGCGGSAVQLTDVLRSYCPLVTNGSYCVVQGTGLSRLAAGPGAAAGVEAYLAESGGQFVPDGSREPFTSQHEGGYLLRVGPEGGRGVAGGSGASSATVAA